MAGKSVMHVVIKMVYWAIVVGHGSQTPQTPLANVVGLNAVFTFAGASPSAVQLAPSKGFHKTGTFWNAGLRASSPCACSSPADERLLQMNSKAPHTLCFLGFKVLSRGYVLK